MSHMQVQAQRNARRNQLRRMRCSAAADALSAAFPGKFHFSYGTGGGCDAWAMSLDADHDHMILITVGGDDPEPFKPDGGSLVIVGLNSPHAQTFDHWREVRLKDHAALIQAVRDMIEQSNKIKQGSI